MSVLAERPNSNIIGRIN